MSVAAMTSNSELELVQESYEVIGVDELLDDHDVQQGDQVRADNESDLNSEFAEAKGSSASRKQSGYFDGNNTFGIMKKGVAHSASDFDFMITAEVICSMPTSSGYLVKLTPQGQDNTTRLCYFTAESTNKKSEFMKCLNSSYKLACLQCSFSDKELSEFIQFKKQTSEFQKKKAVNQIGLQTDGSWVMASNVYLSPKGELMSVTDSHFVWISDFYKGPGIPSNTEQCSIELPLSTDPLKAMMSTLFTFMGHNFMPTVLTMSSVILTLHYQTMLKKLKFCPVPLAFGNSGTGKTTALLCGLSLLGIHETRYYSKVTKEKMLNLVCTSGVPLGVDDPQSRSDISRLLIDLFNGAKSGTMGQGEKKPQSTCVITANFTTLDQQRYSSRCLMIQFDGPSLSFTLSDYMEIVDQWESCSSCAGLCVSLGEKFFSEGIKEIDSNILPLLAAKSEDVVSRVIPSYAILFWYCKQLLIEAGMGSKLADLETHFCNEVLACASKLQSANAVGDSAGGKCQPDTLFSLNFTPENFGEELLTCIRDIPAAQIATFFRTNLQYEKQKAYAVILSKVPGLSLQATTGIRLFLKDKLNGRTNNPRPFSTDEAAARGTMPTEFSKFKATKCTVIVAGVFSTSLQQQLEAATSGTSSSRTQSDTTTTTNSKGKSLMKIVEAIKVKRHDQDIGDPLLSKGGNKQEDGNVQDTVAPDGFSKTQHVAVLTQDEDSTDEEESDFKMGEKATASKQKATASKQKLSNPKGKRKSSKPMKSQEPGVESTANKKRKYALEAVEKPSTRSKKKRQ